ncbi:MAG: hypothetical protein GF408_06375 [Candidatus Omnitrophica bacterium]|nr:hypothetical protein [Candidatus Omnitrophota bacterium]
MREDINIDEVFSAADTGCVYDRVISGTEKLLIEKALKRAFGNQSIAAKLLGINRNTLRLKIRKLGIDVKKYRI